MKRLFFYLRSYAFWIFLCFILLFCQAMSDLSLPSLMSDIVNVGIQKGGIEESAPTAISSDAMKLMRTFLSEPDKKTIDSNYNLVSAGSSSEYIKEYPKSETVDIYVRKSDSDIDKLGAVFGRSAFSLLAYLKDLAEQSGYNQPDQTEASYTKGLDELDLSPLYKMQPMLDTLPAPALDKYIKSSENMDESLLTQVSNVMVKQFYDELSVDTGAIRTRYVFKTGILMLLLTLAGAVATISVSLISARIAADIARRMRRDVFSKVVSFSNAEFDKFSTASLITRTTNDITQVQMLLIMGIRMLCYAPIMGIGGVIMAVNKSPSMSWIIAVAVLILILLILSVFRIAIPKFKLIQKLVDKLNLVTREHLSGMMVIRAFGTQRYEEERFDRTNKELTGVNLFVNRVMVVMMPVMMLLMNGISLLIVWVGAHQIEAATIQVGDMVAFIQYAMQIIISFLMVSVMFIMVPRAAVSASRVSEVLDTEPAILDPDQPENIENRITGRVEFKNVSFRYSGAEDDVLHNISFIAEPGKTTAFIGSTGSGKSTLINLIPRFYDVTEGQILIDGIDVRSFSQHDLHEIIGYVPQKGVLFSGTIASNLRYGRQDATDQEISRAADIAQASEFISTMPEGMNNPIAQGGSNVSGGQKQRLSIARALAKNSPIYIFDDSFSALDFKTDAALRKALKENTGKSTVLIVAQRVGTIMNADQIIVLEQGRIVGKGTHSELLKTCETYREIASSQLTEEELA
jgi:ATP-binding cassette subfamily B multidrug efflux pump